MRSGQNPNSLVVGEGTGPIDGVDDERLVTGQRQKLFRAFGCTHRPEPRADSACEVHAAAALPAVAAGRWADKQTQPGKRLAKRRGAAATTCLIRP